MTDHPSFAGFLLLLSGVLVACAGPAERQGSDPEAAAADAIREAAAAFSRAFEAGDTTALGELYTADALLLAPADTVRGRAAIRRWFRPREGGNDFRHELVLDDLTILDDVAIDRGRWVQSFPRDSASPRRSTGVYLVVWERGADGRWRIRYDMWHAPYD